MANRTKLGWGLTVIWLAVVSAAVCYRWGDIPEMMLNAWGDFFAGIAAPLALLWVVIGFYQQGEELRLNREELALQRKESTRLADSSVEQTKALARQAEAVEKSVQMTREIQESAARPYLVLVSEESGSSGLEFRFFLRNGGADISDFSYFHTGGDQVHVYCNLGGPPWKTDTGRLFTLVKEPPTPFSPEDFPIDISIHATDRLGKQHAFEYQSPKFNVVIPRTGAGENHEL